MPRVTCLRLPVPAPRYRLGAIRTADKHGHNFEKRAFSIEEDRLRAKRLLRARTLLSHPQAKRAKKLAKRLADEKEPPVSLASSQYMRECRKRVCGNLWRLMRKKKDMGLSFFTIVPADWVVSEGQLDRFIPKVMFRRLRSVLYRRGAGEAHGFMFAALHGEHQPELGTYQLHIHGVAGGAMTDVIDQLRTSSNYRSIRTSPSKGAVWQRVQIRRAPLKNLPRIATYVLKAYWPSQSRIEHEGRSPIVSGKKKRIPDPHHSEVLIWLDRLTLPDLLFTIGVSASRRGLKVSRQRVK